jgi:predicted nuclease of predicted toxin-antitoxin system
LIPFLLDQGLPRRAAQQLREQLWDVVHVGELGLSNAPDLDLIALARSQGRAIVTLDGDFARIVAMSGAAAPSIIHVRVEGVELRAVADRLLALLPPLIEDLKLGALVSINHSTARCRPLPIRRP